MCPAPLQGPIRALQVAGKSIDECGEFMAKGLLSPHYARGFHVLDQYGNPATTTGDATHTDGIRASVWTHTLDMLAAAEGEGVEEQKAE